jgi:hypothetical protein
MLRSHDYTIFGDVPIIGSNLDKKFGWVEVRETIGNFFNKAKPSQLLLFYFSGHGIVSGNDVYLGTPQVDHNNPWIKGLSLSDLTKQMSKSKSTQIVGIIDACYSGAADIPSSMKRKAANDNASRALATYDKVWKNTPKSKSVCLLLSSRAYEASNAIEGENSLYTKFLLKGLRGIKPRVDKGGKMIRWSGSLEVNGDVTARSLHDYVYEKVANIIEQVPEIKTDESRSIVLLSYPKLALVNKQEMQHQVTTQTLSFPGRILKGGILYQNDYVFEGLHIYSAQNEIKEGRSTAKIALVGAGLPDETHDAIRNLKILKFKISNASKNQSFNLKLDDTTKIATAMCALIGSPLLKNNFIGVAPYSELLVYDCGLHFAYSGYGSGWNAMPSDLVSGIKEATQMRPQVMLIAMASYLFSRMDRKTETAYKKAISNALQSGIMVISSAGYAFENAKDRLEGSLLPPRPSFLQNSLVVTSINVDDVKSKYSNYGKAVDVCAYGEDIVSAISDNKYQFLNGPAFPPCFVTGAIALMYTVNPKLTPTEVSEIIYESAENIDNKNEKFAGLLGAGKLNAFKTLIETRKRMRK